MRCGKIRPFENYRMGTPARTHWDQYHKQRTAATAVILVAMLLKMAISILSNRPERTAVSGIILVRMLLLVPISISTNGRERTAVTGVILARGGHIRIL